MKKLTKFNEFISNKLLEELNMRVTELELILSERLRKILKEINHQIAHDLLELHKDSETVFKKTFVDLGATPEMVSFIQSNKVPELIEPDITHGTYQRNPKFSFPKNQEDNRKDDEKTLGEYDIVNSVDLKNPWIKPVNHVLDLHEIQFTDKNHPVWKKNRVEVKIGRFINQSFPGKYPTSVKREERPDVPNDVENFINMFIAKVEEKSKMIVAVKGEQIKEYYNCENYFKNTGTLGGSCMKDSSKSDQLNIYTKNSDKIQMLVLYPEDIRDKIIGRALLWKLSEINGEVVKDKYYMDRIYTANDSDEFMYMEYAKKMGYYYKSTQTYGYDYDIVHPDGKKEQTILQVDLNPTSYDSYPYVDTMQFYDSNTGIITNDIKKYNENGYGILTDYNGPIIFR